MQDTLAEGPVAVVCGPAGVGKSTLVTKAIERCTQGSEQQILYVRVPGGNTTPDVRLQVVQMLSSIATSPDGTRSQANHDKDTLTATAIDLAEAGPHWIVVDDLHHADRASIVDLLLQLMSYARRSRWIFTSRTTFDVPQLKPFQRVLPGMSPPDLMLLARTIAPERTTTEHEDAVRTSGGLPWYLMQSLATPAGGDETRTAILGGLDSSARRAIRALAPIETPISLCTLRALEPAATPPVVDALERRGMLQVVGGRARLHDAVRRMNEPSSEAAVISAGRILGESSEPDLVVEGVRLLAESGADDHLARVLEAWGERLLKEGFALRLWQILTRNISSCQATQALSSSGVCWRLSCAVALRDPDLCRSFEQPTYSTPRQAMIWARALEIQADWVRAGEIATRIAEDAGRVGDDELRFEAEMLLGNSLMYQGKVAQARETFDRVAPPNEGAMLLRDIQITKSLALEGSRNQAIALLPKIRRRLPRHARQLPQQTVLAHAVLLGLLDRLRDAYELSGVLLAPPSAADPQALLLRIWLCNELGELEESAKLICRSEPFASKERWRCIFEAARAGYRIASGVLGGLEDVLVELAQYAQSAELIMLAPYIDGMRTHLMMLRAAAPSEVVVALPDEESPALAASPQLRVLRARARAGKPVPRELSNLSFRHAIPGVLARLVIADAALASGDSVGANIAVEAASLARKSHLRILEAESQHTVCDMLLLQGRLNDLRDAATRLETIGAAMPSPRIQQEARFYLAIDRLGRLDRATLVEFDRQENVAPVAARRCRALLGEQVRLDTVDQEVINAIHREVRVDSQVELHSVAGCTVDTASKSICFPDGRRIVLAPRRQLWKLLTVLLSAAAPLNNEALLKSVWGESAYNPLRHDSRIHQAIRRLRDVLEDDPGAPRRLITTELGYTLVGVTSSDKTPSAEPSRT